MIDVGVVAIGRNEGERLRRCLESLQGLAQHVVYVDSGSTDGSHELAIQLGATVLDLDMASPFTAARARNAGLTRLLELAPTLELVQFVDGDCEVARGWLRLSVDFISGDPRLAAVCGRRRERHPDASVYNQLCDLEWDTPIGEALACGGDALMRVRALQEVGGYDARLIAGEEPELCVRLRQRGWRIHRIEAEMTMHDAAMTHFTQWWRRTLRAGHAFAEGAALHGAPPERHWVAERRRAIVWGGLAPALALGLALPSLGCSLIALLVVYSIQAARIALAQRRRGRTPRQAALYGWFCMVGKIPECLGAVQFTALALMGKRRSLIDYKAPQG